MDYEDIALENACFPWLASDCMADQCCEDYPGSDWGYEDDEFGGEC